MHKSLNHYGFIIVTDTWLQCLTFPFNIIPTSHYPNSHCCLYIWHFTRKINPESYKPTMSSYNVTGFHSFLSDIFSLSYHPSVASLPVSISEYTHTSLTHSFYPNRHEAAGGAFCATNAKQVVQANEEQGFYSHLDISCSTNQPY